MNIGHKTSSYNPLTFPKNNATITASKKTSRKAFFRKEKYYGKTSCTHTAYGLEFMEHLRLEYQR